MSNSLVMDTLTTKVCYQELGEYLLAVLNIKQVLRSAAMYLNPVRYLIEFVFTCSYLNPWHHVQVVLNKIISCVSSSKKHSYWYALHDQQTAALFFLRK